MGVRLINASAYRMLSAPQTHQITYILCNLTSLNVRLFKLAFHGADTDTDTDTDTDSPKAATVLRPTHAISSRGSS